MYTLSSTFIGAHRYFNTLPLTDTLAKTFICTLTVTHTVKLRL